MTIPIIKIKVLPKSVVKAKMDARFPANFTVDAPLQLDRTGGNYRVSLDVNQFTNSVIDTVLTYIPAPASATPLTASTAAVGTSIKYAREDHVHPVGNPYQQTFSTLAQAAATSIVGSVDIVRTLGRVSAGDNGGASYVRIGATTAASWRFQSADGQWWALNDRVITPEMFGAVTGGTDCTTAFSDLATWIRTFALRGVTVNFKAGADYSVWPGPGVPATTYLLDLTGVIGLTVNFNGAKITTNNPFNASSVAEVFLLDGTQDLVVNDAWYVQTGKVTLDASVNGGLCVGQATAAPWNRNIIFNNPKQFGGARGITFIGAPFASGIPVDNRVENIQVNNGFFDTVYYPLSFAWAGDNVRANITANNCGRVYFPYNVSNHDISIVSNGGGPFNDMNLKVYAMPQLPPAKNALTNINVRYKNKARINNTASQSLCAIEFQQNPQIATLPTVSGAANNGSGLIRLTISSASAAAMATGQTWYVNNVGGVPNATGNWVVTVVDNTHVDLQGSTFAGAYTSGGYMNVPAQMRDIHITFDVDNDSNQQPPACVTYKLDSAGSADTTQRNYVIDNLTLHGTLSNYNYGIAALNLFNNDAVSLGTWSSETVNNFAIRDLVITGTNTNPTVNVTGFGIAEFKNITSTPTSVSWAFTGISTNTVFQNNSATGVTIGSPVKTVKKQVFTASGTYTPSTGLLYCVIECVGSGGGGGGANNASATQIYGGGGGGSGSYSRLVASAATIGASQTVTVGNAGSGGAAGSNNGTAGSDVSVGTLCIGKGGQGGSFASVAGVPTGGAGGVAGTGDLTSAGQPGGFGGYSTANTTFVASGFGGNSHFGGGAASAMATAGASVSGNAAGNYGGGGSGGSVNSLAGTAAGGNGSKGVVIITEYCLQ